MQQGWIALHRSILEHWLHEDKPFCKFGAWVDLVLLANHEEKKFLATTGLITISRGQLMTSYRSLSERWGWSKDKVSRFLNTLESDGMIQRNQDKYRTLLTIVNYGVYQDLQDNIRTKNGHKSDNGRTAIGQQSDNGRTVIGQNNNVTMNNNEEQCNNENNVTNKKGSKEPVIYFPEDEVLNKALKDYIDYRKKARKPMTDRAIELMIKKINKYESATAVKMLEQSTIRGWSDIYPLNDKPKANEPQTIEERWANVH